MNFRYRCECGNVYDDSKESAICPSCKKTNSTENSGIVQLYRVGNFYCAVSPMNLYVDEQPYGNLVNKGNIKLVVPYGEHKLHAAFSGIKNSNNPTINLTPEEPITYFRTTIPFLGDIIHFNPAEKDTMPK